jgi:hypothetical protein
MKDRRFALLFSFLKDWRFILGLVASLFVCYLCFAYTDKVIRVVCFLVAVFLAFVAFMFFERFFVRIKHKEFFETTTSGKARFPGSNSACIGWGVIALIGATLFIFLGVRL